MNNEFYKFPLELNKISNCEKLYKCGIGESISQTIQLIIYSYNGEHRNNSSLGCKIWDLDFDLIMSVRIWEEKLRSSLMNSIIENIISIEKIDIDVKVSEVETIFSDTSYSAIKRQVDIYLNAVLKQTGERYHFHTSLYLSPISNL